MTLDAYSRRKYDELYDYLAGHWTDRHTLKAISMYEPWATLLAHGAKTFETLDWASWHRGVTLIHTTSSTPTSALRLCEQEPFKTALEAIVPASEWVDLSTGKANHRFRAPAFSFGSIIGAAILVDHQMVLSEDDLPRTFDRLRYPVDARAREVAFGDFSHGRNYFEMTGHVAFDEPIEDVRGARRIWTLYPTEEQRAALAAQVRAVLARP